MTKLNDSAKQIVSGVDGKYFMVSADGEIRSLGKNGKATRWVWTSKQRAISWAQRFGFLVWDKEANKFLNF
jgi:hypothetical protein